MEDFKYTSVNWHEHFYLDASSPSGLRRTKDVFTGRKHCQARYKKDDVVGSERWYDETRAQCWQVTYNRQTYRVHRIMWVMLNGIIDKGLFVDHLDGNPLNNKVDNLCLKTHRGNQQNQKLRSTNTSGYKGISLSNTAWVANWRGIDSKNCSKSFNIKRYGKEEALRLAVDCRKRELNNLNKLGMNYSDRHINN